MLQHSFCYANICCGRSTDCLRQHALKTCRLHSRVTCGPSALLSRVPILCRSRLQAPRDVLDNLRSSSSSSSSSSRDRDSQRRDSQYEASTSQDPSGSKPAELALQDQDQRQRKPRGPIQRLMAFIAMIIRTVLVLPPRYGPHLPAKEGRSAIKSMQSCLTKTLGLLHECL